jgi:tetratricopeptide (TPR) repeat protein
MMIPEFMSQIRPAVLFTLVAVTAIQYGCRSPEQREAVFLARGRQQYENKDYNRAILNFKNAVAVAPKDDKAYYQLGMAFLQIGDLRDSAVAFKRATDLNPKNTEAQVKLAELMVLRGDVDSAKQSMERMQVLTDSLDNAGALTALALGELRFHDSQDAERHLRQALQRFPQNLQPFVILARMKLQLHEYDAAEQVLKQAIEHNPKAVEATLGLAFFYRFRGRWTEAEERFQKVLNIDPRNAAALDGLASVQFQNGQKKQAEQSYRQLAALGDKRYEYRHAAFLFEEGQRDAAIAEFAKLANEDPSDRTARTHLISAYLVAGRMPDAEKLLASALKANPKDVDALLQRAQILVLSGRADEGQGDLVKVLKYQPTAPLAHYLLAKVHQAHGNAEQQRQELERTLQLQADLLGVRIELAQAQLEAKQPKAALELMNEAPAAQRNTLPSIVQRNWALLALGDLSEVGKGLTQGLALGRPPDLLLQGGLLESRQHHYPGARAYLTEALERNPEDLRSLETLARIYAEQGQASVAFQKVREYVARRPKSAPMQAYLGEQLQISGDRTGARNAYNAAVAADSGYMPARLGLAQLDLIEGHFDESRKTASAVLASGKDVLPARLMLAAIETKSGNYGAAIDQYRKILETAPTNPRALNDIAYLLAEYQNRPDEALKYAQRAAEIAPDDPSIQDTMGWVLYRKGVYLTAVKCLANAASGTNLPVIKYHLAMAYLKAGQLDLGRQTLDAALRIDPTLAEARMAKQTLTETMSVRKR